LLSVFPLEMRLGIVVGKATLGLAERIGKWTAQYTQGVRSVHTENLQGPETLTRRFG
jgi:hypothetical protein